MTNLILDPIWPFRRADGSLTHTHLWALTEIENPVIDLELPRADFRACGYQILVALMQTALAPETPRDWRQTYAHPPSPEDLRSRLEPLAPAFRLDGDGPRFMQDLELREDEAEPKGIAALLIESPGGNTLKHNADHFIKRDLITALDPFQTAMALWTLQSSAPSGGVGHRTSLRGGGPLSCLVMGPDEASLWQTIYLNVLERKTVAPEGEAPPEAIFPWMKPTRISTKNRAVHRDDVHGLQVFWAMPRRIRLCAPETGACSLTGVMGPVYGSFVTKNYGNNYLYTGWQHPLSPHYQNKDEILPVLGNRSLLVYPSWLGLVLGDKPRKRFPARVTKAFIENRGRQLPGTRKPRLWITGYDMDNMKARAWIDQEIPVVTVEGDPEPLRIAATGLVQTARQVASTLSQQTKAALGDTKTRGSYEHVAEGFWEATEQQFYQHIDLFRDGTGRTEVLEGWLGVIHRAALSRFDRVTDDFPPTATDQKRIVEARWALHRYTKPTGDRIRGLAGLPALPKKEKP